MDLNSKYFDRIRIRGEATVEKPKTHTCDAPGCNQAGEYRAPKGRGREGQYYNFCLDHVREYNKSYNYFAGMPDDEVISYQRSASTGHRPTWAMGVNRNGEKATGDPRFAWAEAFADTFGVFNGDLPGGKEKKKEPERRPLRNLERRSFAALDLEGHEPAEEIKARYKELVKRLHPDANGGDRSSEDRLRQIIQAYHYLRSVGFC